MNKICIVGRLVADPETKNIGADKLSVCEFCVAVDKARKKDETDFFNVKAWGKTGEFVQSYLSKGRLVSVAGRMDSRKTERDGIKVTYWDLVADDVNALDKRPEGTGQTTTSGSSNSRGQWSGRRNIEPAPPPPLPGELDIEDPFA